MEDEGAKQFEAGAAVHGALDHLDPEDLGFHWASGPGQRQRCVDGVIVTHQARGELAKQRVGAGGEHRIEAFDRILPQQPGARSAHPQWSCPH